MPGGQPRTAIAAGRRWHSSTARLICLTRRGAASAGTLKPARFDVVVVHSFSRFFRDHFELEFYVRKLAKNGVRPVSITEEMGDDPMHVMMRPMMALFYEYQSKENA